MSGTGTPGKITAILRSMEGQDKSTIDVLFESLYQEIHALAVQQLRRLSPGETLTPTVLVHECYLRLIHQHAHEFKDSQHMLAHLAKVMRCYLVDNLRHRKSHKRNHQVVSDERQLVGANGINLDLLDLERTLKMMEKIDPALTRLLEMRYFLGLTVREIVELTGQSERQLYRQWKEARTLFIALNDQGPTPNTNHTV